MVNIFQISEEENRLIQLSESRYGKIFKDAHETIIYSWEVIDSYEESAWIFHSFITQVNKAFNLSLLSIVRRHDIQSQMNLRHALESSALACYALCKPQQDEFIYKDDNNIIRERKVKKSAYDWLDKNYPHHSEKIKFFKDNINNLFAHSNLITALSNVDNSNDSFTAMYFDNSSDILIKIRLWIIANICLVQLDLWWHVLREYPLAELRTDYAERTAYYWDLNNSHKAELLKHPEYSNVFPDI